MNIPNLSGVIPMADDIARPVARWFGQDSAPAYKGKFGSDQFFTDLAKNDEAAIGLLKKKNYSATWNVPLLRRSAAQEIRRSASRTTFQKLTPRGLLTGYGHYGIGRASNTLFNKLNFKIAAGMGLVQGALTFGSAPRGRLGSELTKVAGQTVGGYLGAGVGGALLGLPGEVIGGIAGAEIGEKAEAALDFVKSAYNQGHHLNFGQGFQDTEEAYTMRQRAVQEMGRSALNARQYLGKEALLFHQ